MERKMARRFVKVSEEEIKTAFFLSIWFGKYLNNYPPQGRWRAVDIYLDASRLGISTTIHLPFGG